VELALAMVRSPIHHGAKLVKLQEIITSKTEKLAPKLEPVLVFLWGGMNSWFLYEFTVLSMGSILANVAEIYLKLIMPIDHGVRERDNRYRLMNAMVRSSVSLCAPAVGLIVVVELCQKKKNLLGKS
jgi:hypothetical protein